MSQPGFRQRSIIDLNGWLSTNPYDTNFKEPSGAGIYAFFECNEFGYKRLLYIGSSTNLKARLAGHEVQRIGRFFCWHIAVYWRNEENYRMKEKAMIDKFNPPLNTQQ